MFKIKSFPIPGHIIECFFDEGSILGVSSLQYEFDCRFVDLVPFKNSKRLV